MEKVRQKQPLFLPSSLGCFILFYLPYLSPQSTTEAPVFQSFPVTMGLEDVPKKMRAIQVVEFNKSYQINQVPVPTDLKPTDILVKVAVASNCHTDGMYVNRPHSQPTTRSLARSLAKPSERRNSIDTVVAPCRVQQGIMKSALPQTASHEGAGTIVALGSLAAERGFKEGMRVRFSNSDSPGSPPAIRPLFS